jgi:hypothetical protein
VGYEGGGRGFRSEVEAGEANCAIAYPPSFVQPDPVALGDLDLDASSLPAWPIDHGARKSQSHEIGSDRREQFDFRSIVGWRVNGDISQ